MLLYLWAICAFVLLIWAGTWQVHYRAFKVAGVAGTFSAIAASPIFIASIILMFVMFGFGMILIAAILTFLAKTKFIIFLKLSGLFLALSGFFGGLLTGPITPILSIIFLLILGGTIWNAAKEWTWGIYLWIIETASVPLAKLRRTSDKLTSRFGTIGLVAFFPLEFCLVNLLPVYGMLEVLMLFDGSQQPDTLLTCFRYLLVGCYALIVYTQYRSGTAGLENVPLDLPDIVDVDGDLL